MTVAYCTNARTNEYLCEWFIGNYRRVDVFRATSLTLVKHVEKDSR
jgi:hypothetical protein